MVAVLAEEIFHALTNYIPYVIFTFFVFRSSYKCSEKVLLLAVIFSGFLHVVLLVLPHFAEDYSVELLSFALTAVSVIFYVLIVEVSFFQALFRCLIVNNIANFVVVAAKCLEGWLFPTLAAELYRWSYSLCTMIVQAIVLIPAAVFFRRWCPEEYLLEADTKIWRRLCLVPVIFYVIWYYIFYYTSDTPSLYMALEPINTWFLFFLLLGQMFIYYCVLSLVAAHNKMTLLKEENNLLDIQTLQYQGFQQKIQELRVMKHDMRHHLALMCSYADNNKYDELKAYLHNYSEELADSSTVVYCGNSPLNMLLLYYGHLCREQKIAMDIRLDIPERLILSDSEVTVLFGNLLENAYDACIMQKNGSRKIVLHGLCRQQQIIVTLDNTFDNKISTDEKKHFLSAKHEGYGFGIESAKNVVQKHGGIIEFEVREHWFCVSIMFPENYS